LIFLQMCAEWPSRKTRRRELATWQDFAKTRAQLFLLSRATILHTTLGEGALLHLGVAELPTTHASFTAGWTLFQGVFEIPGFIHSPPGGGLYEVFGRGRRLLTSPSSSIVATSRLRKPAGRRSSEGLVGAFVVSWRNPRGRGFRSHNRR